MGFYKKFSVSVFSAAICSFNLCFSSEAVELSAEAPPPILWTTPWEALEHGQDLTYDLLSKWYESIENEDGEFNGTGDDLSKTMQWLFFLARVGLIPGDEEELENDIKEIVEACREDKKDCGDDRECMEFDCERILNLDDIPAYLKVLLLPR